MMVLWSFVGCPRRSFGRRAPSSHSTVGSRVSCSCCIDWSCARAPDEAWLQRVRLFEADGWSVHLALISPDPEIEETLRVLRAEERLPESVAVHHFSREGAEYLLQVDGPARFVLRSVAFAQWWPDDRESVGGSDRVPSGDLLGHRWAVIARESPL
jgi:hypothetical protein